MSTFIIAEAASAWRYGTQHLHKALRMINVAKEAGASAVKFQWVSDPRQMEQRRKVPVGTYDILAWPKNWLDTLKKECDTVGIEFMCTVFLPKDVPLIAPYVERFKVASLECYDWTLLKQCAQYGKSVVRSLGATEPIAPWLPMNGIAFTHYDLHCTATYPCPPEHANLKALQIPYYSLGGPRFRGYSDHTANVLTGALAVTLGAEIIEVHFRLSRTPADNPDYPHSLSPERLEEYVRNIRVAEVMLGDGIKKIEPCEASMIAHRVEA